MKWDKQWNASPLSIFKDPTVYRKIVSYLKHDKKNFDAALGIEDAIKTNDVVQNTLKTYLVFENICNYLRDDDRASFYLAVNPPWDPWFFSKDADWKLISKVFDFDFDFLWKCRHKLDWKFVCESRYFSTKEMDIFKNFINFNAMYLNQHFTKSQEKIAGSCGWTRPDAFLTGFLDEKNQWQPVYITKTLKVIMYSMLLNDE